MTTEKPVSVIYRPELTRLPRLTRWRKAFRWFIKGLAWVVSGFLVNSTLNGHENFPVKGPVLIVSNHLGDADGIVGLALADTPVDVMGKSELYDIPILGRLLDWYGMIWVHRGRPDRRALKVVLDGLAEGRMVAIAPEGRESVSGSLEWGTDGAAYIALKADVPILPVVLTGTENRIVYSNIKKIRRSQVTLTVGAPFKLEKTGERRSDLERGTRTIMIKLAQMLPPEYRGVYQDIIEEKHDSR